MEIERKGDLLSKEKKKLMVENVISFFKDERDEDVGIIFAESILDLFLQDVGQEIYNKGVDDARNFLKKKFEDLELDMEVLLKK